jgi:hypothetical protein
MKAILWVWERDKEKSKMVSLIPTAYSFHTSPSLPLFSLCNSTEQCVQHTSVCVVPVCHVSHGFVLLWLLLALVTLVYNLLFLWCVPLHYILKILFMTLLVPFVLF